MIGANEFNAKILEAEQEIHYAIVSYALRDNPLVVQRLRMAVSKLLALAEEVEPIMRAG